MRERLFLRLVLYCQTAFTILVYFISKTNFKELDSFYIDLLRTAIPIIAICFLAFFAFILSQYEYSRSQYGIGVIILILNLIATFLLSIPLSHI
tara:strand:- start:2396 stop:2677 length:282 start_codon:yes stop_codon:yes gene_type:complete